MADAPRKPSRKQGIPGQWMWQTVTMKESPAWRALSLSARKILDRVEIELAHHGGDRGGRNENGRLPVTYDDFEAYGMDRHSIGPAISEAVALGFLEVTEKGCAGNEQFRRPNKYRLTYRFSPGQQAPTDEWRAIESSDEAQRLARAARTARRENRSPVGVLSQPVVRKTPTTALVGKTPTTALVGKTPTTFDISGGSRHVDGASMAAHAEKEAGVAP